MSTAIALAGLIGVNLGMLIGWFIANTRVEHPEADSPAPDHDGEGEHPAVVFALEPDADVDRFIQEAEHFDEVKAAARMAEGARRTEVGEP